MHSILMIDDQPEQLASHTQFLKEKGCSVTVASSVQAAFDKLHQSSYDLILLDVKMPKVSGLDCCRALRNVSSAPVLFLSNYSEDNDQVRGFSAGGYDYISKECSLELFWARLRRCFQPKDQANTLRYYPPMTLDLERQKVTLGQKTVLLTPTEFSLLILLSSRPGKIWTINEIYREIWGAEGPVNITMVQMHLSRMRRKLEEAFPQHEFVVTVWGKGYQFVLMDEADRK
ncbi:MAG: response regulator transcription factor [Firmicutes bacterium]|nr:response regulator transcription factor [Bacillota bacterium]